MPCIIFSFKWKNDYFFLYWALENNFHQCQLLCFRNSILRINPKFRINNAAVHCCEHIHMDKVELWETHSCIRRDGLSPSLNFTSFSQRLSMRASCFSVSRINSRDTILFITLSTSARMTERQQDVKSSIQKEEHHFRSVTNFYNAGTHTR